MNYKKILSGLLALTLSAQFTTALAFSDIQGHWAAQSIIYMEDQGMLTGYRDGTFRPDTFVSRAEWVAFCNRVFDLRETAELNFADVSPEDWFYADLQAGVKAGIFNGTGEGLALPQEQVTREQAAAVIARALALEDGSGELGYTDAWEIADWAKGAVSALAQGGLMGGFLDGSFQPKGGLTRAQAATVLKNVMEYKKEQETMDPPMEPIAVPSRPEPEPAPVRAEITQTRGNVIPSGLAASDILPTSVVLKWTQVKGADSYDISDGDTFLCNVPENKAVVKGLTPGAQYRLTVTARYKNGGASAPSQGISVTTIDSGAEQYQVLRDNLKGAFDYLWNEGNTDENSRGYGIIRDNSREEMKNYGSIAATGFALAAIPVGVEQGYITWEEGYQRTVGTLRTFWNQVPQEHGFFPHFVRVTNGTPFDGVEISIIDSSLFLAGAVTASEYFGSEAKELTQKLYERMDWDWYRKKLNNRFYMGYRHEKFSGEWNTCAEQFIQYVFGSASPTHPVEGQMFYDINRWEEEYDGITYRRSWDNSLFQYQFSHAFIDFRGTRDREGVDWFENSRLASLAHRKYSINNPLGWKTHNENSWGLTASYTYEGYKGGLGALPHGMQGNLTPTKDSDNGSIAPYGAVGSLPFVPEESAAAANYYKDTYPQLWGPYGLKESYSLDVPDGPFFADVYYGINKGIEALQTANFFDGTVWEYFMRSEMVQKGMEEIEVK